MQRLIDSWRVATALTLAFSLFQYIFCWNITTGIVKSEIEK